MSFPNWDNQLQNAPYPYDKTPWDENYPSSAHHHCNNNGAINYATKGLWSLWLIRYPRDQWCNGYQLVKWTLELASTYPQGVSGTLHLIAGGLKATHTSAQSIRSHVLTGSLFPLFRVTSDHPRYQAPTYPTTYFSTFDWVTSLTHTRPYVNCPPSLLKWFSMKLFTSKQAVNLADDATAQIN